MKHISRFILLTLACCLAMTGCGDDTTQIPPDATIDGATHSTDSSQHSDVPAVCENICFDNFGKSKKSLCPDPISDWNCIKGCCEPVFRCVDDADCARRGVSEEQCQDLGFDCRCTVSDGTCYDWYCGVDSDCAEGELCAAGKCQATPGTADLAIRFVSQSRVLATGAQAQLLVEGFNPKNADVVVEVDVTYESQDAEVVSVSADGEVTGGSKDGNVAVIAMLVADPSVTASVQMRNVATTPGQTLLVLATQRNSVQAVAGRYALIGSQAGETLAAGALPDSGVIAFTDPLPEGGVDVHVFGAKSDWISVLGVKGGVVLLPSGEVAWSELAVTKDGEVDLEASSLDGMRAISGIPDFSDYDKTGEFEVTLNCFALSDALFDFSLDALLGSDMKRYFHPDASIPGIDKTEPAEMPGGVTFGLGGPALPEYWLASTPNKRLLWTLGGRVELGEVAPIIGDVLDALTGGDDLDIGKLVSAIIPLFGSFWSAINPDVTIEPGDASEVITLNPTLRVPMGLSSSLNVPPLPAIEDKGWADALFMIAGAFTADGNMIPLGLNAGTDTIDAKLYPGDGRADADPKTPEMDPFKVPFAMLHSGLGGPHTRYGVATVAAIIRGSDDPRPEGGSAILTVAEPQTRLPENVNLDDFLGFPLGSQWDPDTRAITVEALPGADSQRVLFKGSKGAHWTIWMRGQTTYTVPVVSELFDGDELMLDRASDNRLILINSFDFEEGISIDDILSPSHATLDLLLNVTNRVSFVDVRPTKTDNEE
jgi:hypothetical protein